MVRVCLLLGTFWWEICLREYIKNQKNFFFQFFVSLATEVLATVGQSSSQLVLGLSCRCPWDATEDAAWFTCLDILS